MAGDYKTNTFYNWLYNTNGPFSKKYFDFAVIKKECW